MVVAVPVPARAALSPSEFESCLLTKINADRAAVGVAPLLTAWYLMSPVRNWSEWMSDNTFRHMTSQERDPILPDGTTTWGENIAMNSNTSGDCSAIHSRLMSSGDHRANILNPAFRFAAFGAHLDSSGWWVTELFFDAVGYPPSPDLCAGGSGCDTVAFQEGSGRFRIWTAATSGAALSTFYYGNPGDVAFSGDWDCDGVETLGLYRRADGYAYLRNSNTQGPANVAFYFGIAGDLPLSGDFDGDGCDTVSIYRPSEGRLYIINQLGSDNRGLPAEYTFVFGNPGDKPFVGDFNGDGVDTIGLHRESTGLVYFRDTNTTGVADYSFIYGDPGDRLVAGDWDGDGDDTVGVYRPSNRMLYLRNSNTLGVADAYAYAGSYSGIVSLDP